MLLNFYYLFIVLLIPTFSFQVIHTFRHFIPDGVLKNFNYQYLKINGMNQNYANYFVSSSFGDQDNSQSSSSDSLGRLEYESLMFRRPFNVGNYCQKTVKLTIDIEGKTLNENDELTHYCEEVDYKMNHSMKVASNTDQNVKLFEGIVNDFNRRLVHYKSDWTDGITRKSLSASIFLYFACLAPTIAFGAISNQITKGKIGVIHFMLSTGLSGIMYSIFSGQPMTFVGPTGLTLAFLTALFRFTEVQRLPFLTLYSTIGIHTAILLFFASIFNLAKYMNYSTRFTDDSFNAVLAMNFLYEASESLMQNFAAGNGGYTPSTLIAGFASLNMAISTWVSTKALVNMKSSQLFNSSIRKFCSDFGPTISILFISFIASNHFIKDLGIKYLALHTNTATSIASSVKYAQNSITSFSSITTFITSMIPTVPFATQYLQLPWNIRLLSFIPAILLTMLFYLDHNISIRAVNSCPNMVKGEANHWDLMVLSIIVGLQSLVGLPWTCAATVQSLNHVRALTTEYNEVFTDETEVVNNPVQNYNINTNGEIKSSDYDKDFYESSTKLFDNSLIVTSQHESSPPVTKTVSKTIETRVTGVLIHSMILLSLGFIPLINLIPFPVISGIFLYLGEKMILGNIFLERLNQIFLEKKLLPKSNIYRQLPIPTVQRFVAIQTFLLVFIWILKQSKQFSLLFPSCIGLLIFIRWKILPFWFNETELRELDPMI